MTSQRLCDIVGRSTGRPRESEPISLHVRKIYAPVALQPNTSAQTEEEQCGGDGGAVSCNDCTGVVLRPVT